MCEDFTIRDSDYPSMCFTAKHSGYVYQEACQKLPSQKWNMTRAIQEDDLSGRSQEMVKIENLGTN